MPRDQHEGLSKYERAVAYYTLPRVTSPVTFGLIVAYLVCLLEAVAALIYGLVSGNPVWTKWGAIALAGIIVFGIVAFLFRAFLNEVRVRTLMTRAHRIQDPDSKIIRASGVSQWPDPFANHVLWRYPLRARGQEISITDKAGQIVYTAATESKGHVCTILDAEGETIGRVEAVSGGKSFALYGGKSAYLTVSLGDREIASVSTAFSFSTPVVSIACREPAETQHTIRGGSIYRNDQLVGRIYEVRGILYLDIDRNEVNPGILAFYLIAA